LAIIISYGSFILRNINANEYLIPKKALSGRNLKRFAMLGYFIVFMLKREKSGYVLSGSKSTAYIVAL